MFSEIEGRIKLSLMHCFGDILFNMLPAGSICEVPRKPNWKRGYYMGVFLGYMIKKP